MHKVNKKNIKQLITNAKSIPVALYQLVVINFVIFVGTVLRDFTILYISSCFVIVLASILLIAKLFNLPTPSRIVSDNVEQRVIELRDKVTNQLQIISLESGGCVPLSKFVNVTNFICRFSFSSTSAAFLDKVQPFLSSSTLYTCWCSCLNKWTHCCEEPKNFCRTLALELDTVNNDKFICCGYCQFFFVTLSSISIDNFNLFLILVCILTKLVISFVKVFSP